ncbi:MAG: hypothetical protein HYX27_06705 [Acidobacteria bacterium]|nr:hypothetical protein [Acidobacteriota bacterium]
MIRLIAIALAGIVLAGGVAYVFGHAAGLPSGHPICRLGICGNLLKTASNEPLNPFVWSDIAEERAAAGDTTGARDAFGQAVKLGPNVPPVLIRVVNFAVANGELERSTPHVRHVLELTPAYDNVIFRYLSRSEMTVGRILKEVIPDPGSGLPDELTKQSDAAGNHASAPGGEGRPRGDAARAWVAYLIADRRPEADAAYAWMRQRDAVTPALRNQWIEYLVGVKKDYAGAMESWAGAEKQDGYPWTNRIFNSHFSREVTGSRMDWILAPHPHVAAQFEDGLLLTFDGLENTAYGNLTEQTFLPGGRWKFSADAVADGLNTDQRPFFRIYDATDPRRLDVSTPMAPERMAVEFTSPPGGSWVSVTLQRRQSEKFDNKIHGTLRVRKVWIGGA